MNAPSNTCTECGAELADDAVRGLCPRCLLQAGLGSQSDPDATVPFAGGTGRRRTLPEVGERFGPYRILRLLGRGGMGVVYEAEEQETGRRVALKVLGRQFDSHADRARFLREGRLAASINHPNSVYVYGTQEIDGTPTIAMELVSGGTLQERVKNHGPLPLPAAVEAVLDIIAGLEAAQAIGILHRDIKPGNCFEDTDGTIKIGDFGLSISTAARAETNLTAEGTIVGTPAFCSPEQLRGEEFSTRSDMYSVGATLFYLLTGRVPFEGHNIAQLTANVLEKPVPSPRDFRREIPKGLALAVQRCLAKQPAERFKSYDDLRRALAPYGSTAPTPATLSLRFLAGVLDGLVTALIGSPLLWLQFADPTGWLTIVGRSAGDRSLWMLGGTFAIIFYYAVFEGLWGASAGKALCRLRVVGPDKNPPGFLRAFLRALLFVALPGLPVWIAAGGDPMAIMKSSMAIQQLIALSYYVVLALLFCTARRRNGFAAVQDLLTKTRVISRAALELRPALWSGETSPPAVDDKAMVGPYHVLETVETGAEGQWLLGYDLRLLRKVWIRTVPPGTPPVAAPLRNVSRVGRLRWLAGRRTPEDNWDAFEGVGGQPLLRLIQTRQPWRQVRFWLYDLAREIAAAEKDGTLPPTAARCPLTLDRVWITADGRAKLLDFPAPGLAAAGLPQAAPMPDAASLPESGRTQRFLGEVAVAALEGRADAADEPAVRLPLHARSFLKDLPRFSGADAVAGAIQPLLSRSTAVTRLRRAAVVAGCAALPVFASIFTSFGLAAIQHSHPGLFELAMLLQARQAIHRAGEEVGGANAAGQEGQTFTDRQVAVVIASHYRATIANDDAWNDPFVLSLIKGEERRFAEQSVADHPAPTQEEIADAEAALKPRLLKFAALAKPDPFAFAILVLTICVCLPALIAALLFRGGLVLRIAGVTFVRRNGKPASRLRVFWRSLVAWSPLWLVLIGSLLVSGRPDTKVATDLILALYCGLAVLSVAVPQRGLADRMAGTWPVPR